MRTVYKSDHYQADLFGSSGTELVISFTEVGNRTLSGDGFGGRFLRDSGFDVLAIKSSRDYWYSDLPSDCFRYINAALSNLSSPHAWRAGYGSSMGAYAAMMFAKPLKLDSVLAISPQFDIAQPWDNRWKREANALGTIPTLAPEGASSYCQYHVVYDPWDRDILHARRYSEVIPGLRLHEIKVPHSGHPAGYVLRDVGVLKRLAQDILRGGQPMSGWQTELRAKRRLSSLYLFNLGRHLSQRGRTGGPTQYWRKP